MSIRPQVFETNQEIYSDVVLIAYRKLNPDFDSSLIRTLQQTKGMHVKGKQVIFIFNVAKHYEIALSTTVN